jgi:hypothetical protein
VRLLDPENPLAAEINQEMATTYFAACRRMVAALDALKVLDAATATDGDDGIAARRVDLLAEAAERVYNVVVQREAMQMTGQQQFFADFGVPDEVRLRLGPRGRR